MRAKPCGQNRFPLKEQDRLDELFEVIQFDEDPHPSCLVNLPSLPIHPEDDGFCVSRQSPSRLVVYSAIVSARWVPSFRPTCPPTSPYDRQNARRQPVPSQRGSKRKIEDSLRCQLSKLAVNRKAKDGFQDLRGRFRLQLFLSPWPYTIIPKQDCSLRQNNFCNPLRGVAITMWVDGLRHPFILYVIM